MNYDYTIPAPVEEQGEYVAGLVRHLKARLEEFFCVTLTCCDEQTGKIEAEFAGHSAKEIAIALEEFRGFQVVAEEGLTFYLRKSHRHEENDTIWGGIYHHII